VTSSWSFILQLSQ